MRQASMVLPRPVGDQEEVVAPGRRDLGRSNRRPLTADIGEVGVEGACGGAVLEDPATGPRR